MKTCRICSSELSRPFWQAPRAVAVSSLARPVTHDVEIYICSSCGHIQKERAEEPSVYYDKSYNFYTDSDDSDQIYDVDGPTIIYRNQHQAETFLELIDLPRGAAVLDFGAAKGASLRHIRRQRPDIDPFVFEVSEAYVPFWRKWFGEGHYACYELPDAWTSKFDAVFSGFTHHHVDNPLSATQALHRCLKPGGWLYILVPNPLVNLGDILVSDHPQHYTVASLVRLLECVGFDQIRVDTSSHFAGLIAYGRRAGGAVSSVVQPGEIGRIQTQLRALCDYWEIYIPNLERAEQSDPGKSAIYGAFFYGVLLKALLRQPSRVACFLDRNPFYWNQTCDGLPVYAPENFPEGISRVYMAVKPQIAAAAAASVPAFRKRGVDVILPPTPPASVLT
jgi:SAM-dependent methyltransferase